MRRSAVVDQRAAAKFSHIHLNIAQIRKEYVANLVFSNLWSTVSEERKKPAK
jgi:hypothetical protein